MIDYQVTASAQPYFQLHGGENTDYRCRAEMPMLSIKSMFHGPPTYETDDGGCFVVDDNVYLILNYQQPYTMVKAARTPVESFYVFFGEGLARDIARAASLPDCPLLDEPVDHTGLSFHFLERIYPHDDLVSPHLLAIRAAAKASVIDQQRLEEALHSLLLAMLQTQRHLFSEIGV